MIFCNTFLNFNPCFALGNYFGNCLSNFVFGQKQNTYTSVQYNTFSLGGGMSFPAMPSFSFPSVFTYNFTPTIIPQPNLPFNINYDNLSLGGNNFNTVNLPYMDNFDTFTIGQSKSFTNNNKRLKTYDQLKSLYNAENGKKLADYAKQHATGTTGNCSKFVSNALEGTGLMGNMTRGHAYKQQGKLRKNPNFKEVSVEGTDWNKLPAGCILCYNKGSQNYSAEHGHIQITTGDGKAVSDFEATEIKKPDAIFMPV